MTSKIEPKHERMQTRANLKYKNKQQTAKDSTDSKLQALSHSQCSLQHPLTSCLANEKTLKPK
uniref:Uncharacterized protein n=1 Tax=Cucumis melo TaxID=3656 RepID=A0A9I9E364_CUCME